MKLPAVKKLAETCTREQLQAAEQDILEGRALQIDVEGEDEGEQLTHVLSAMQVLDMMEKEGLALPMALRNMAQKVRTSISSD
jgi:hypothetical protein